MHISRLSTIALWVISALASPISPTLDPDNRRLVNHWDSGLDVGVAQGSIKQTDSPLMTPADVAHRERSSKEFIERRMKKLYDDKGVPRLQTDEERAFFEIGREVGACMRPKMKAGGRRRVTPKWREEWRLYGEWLLDNVMELQKNCLSEVLAKADQFGWSDEDTTKVQRALQDRWARQEESEKMRQRPRRLPESPLHLITTPSESKQARAMPPFSARLQGLGRTVFTAIQRTSGSSSSTMNVPPQPEWTPAKVARLGISS